MKVKKAVIVAAGRGTRFLPATKIIPKELLPIGNYPTIHYLLEECKSSGIEEVCIVLREYGSLTEKYFEKNVELEDYLLKQDKTDLLARISDPGLGLKISFVKQDSNYPVGHGAGVLSAQNFVDFDNFAMLFCDDLVATNGIEDNNSKPALQQLIDAWQQNPELAGIVMSSPVPLKDIGLFSSVKFQEEEELNDRVRLLDNYIEKPQNPADVFEPECFIGRAVYTSEIVEQLEKTFKSTNWDTATSEFSLWDAMLKLVSSGGIGVRQIEGDWLTTGTPAQMKHAQFKLLRN